MDSDIYRNKWWIMVAVSLTLFMGALFASRLVYYAGQPVDISDAPAAAMVSALHDQFLVVAGLIAVGLLLALLAWRRERQPAAPVALPPSKRL
jgi:hypothetical protein